MAKADQHFQQAKENLLFLEGINKHLPKHLDWQVTVAFYTALHIVNGHIAGYNLNYKSHKDIFIAVSSENTLSPMKLPENAFIAYQKLFELSRRSRYLVIGTEKSIDNEIKDANYMNTKLLARAIRHLCTILAWAETTNSLAFNTIQFKCIDLSQNEGDAIKYIKLVAV